MTFSRAELIPCVLSKPIIAFDRFMLLGAAFQVILLTNTKFTSNTVKWLLAAEEASQCMSNKNHLLHPETVLMLCLDRPILVCVFMKDV